MASARGRVRPPRPDPKCGKTNSYLRLRPRGIEPAKPSPSARAKAAGKSTPDATAMHSFHTLLADLSTVVLNDVSIGESESFKLAAAPTPGQQKAFDLLGVNPKSMFPKAGR